VATVASSLERFHEYWIRATFLHKKDQEKEFDSTWRLVAAQTERQYGAFLLLYLRETGRTPPYLAEKLVKFRNDVVHKGAFPSRSDATDYAEQVLKLIALMNRELQALAPDGVAALKTQQEMEIAKEDAIAAAIVTIVGRATDMSPKHAVFKDELQFLDERRQGKGVAEVSVV